MLGCLWEYRLPEVAMTALSYFDDFCLGVFVLATLAVGRGFQILMMMFYEVRLGVPAGKYRSRRRFWPWLLVAAAITSTSLWFELPMRTCFTLSRPAMDRIADQALANPASAHLLAGRWIGLYHVVGVQVIGGTVVMYLGEDDSAYGFARVPGATRDHIFNAPGIDDDNQDQYRDFPLLQTASEPSRVGERIAGSWFVMYSHYWRIKVGWS